MPAVALADAPADALAVALADAPTVAAAAPLLFVTDADEGLLPAFAFASAFPPPGTALV